MQAESQLSEESSTPERLLSAPLGSLRPAAAPFKECVLHVRRTAPRTEALKRQQRTCEIIVCQADLVHALGKRAPLLWNGPLQSTPDSVC